MDPLRHSSLLREMGIAWYVPRNPVPLAPVLPGYPIRRVAAARDTVQRAVPASATVVRSTSQHSNEPETKTATSPEQALTDLRSFRQAPVAPVGKPVVAPQPVPRASQPQDADQPQLAYNLLVIAYRGAAMFVASIKTTSLDSVWEQSARAFMDDVVRAITAQAPPPARISYLNWPMPGQQVAGNAEAEEFTSGFLRGVLNDTNTKTVFLLGSAAQQYAGKALQDLAALRILAVPSMGELFSEPAAKADLWRKCQTL